MATKKSTLSTAAPEDPKTEPKLDVKVSRTGLVTIPGVKTDRLTTLLIGTAPLICHKFSEKLRKMILDKHKGEASAGRERKDPVANYMAARYRLMDGSDGVPAGGVKAAIVDGFSKAAGVPITRAKGGIRVSPDCQGTNNVRIIHATDPSLSDQHIEGLSAAEYKIAPRLREDVVRNESGVVDIRHRPEYWPWAMRVEVEFLPSVCSLKQVLQAIATSGFTVGLCEWRPSSKQSKSGSYGTWRLATQEEVEAYENGTLFADWTPGQQQAAE